MILWCLRGYADPEGEFEGGEVECAIERAEDGYRLLVSHDSEIQMEESHATIETVRGKAEMLREEPTVRATGTWVIPSCRNRVSSLCLNPAIHAATGSSSKR